MTTNQAQHIHLRSQNCRNPSWCMKVHSQTFLRANMATSSCCCCWSTTFLSISIQHPLNSSFDVSSTVYITLGLSYLDLRRSNLCIYDTFLKMHHGWFLLNMADWKWPKCSPAWQTSNFLLRTGNSNMFYFGECKSFTNLGVCSTLRTQKKRVIPTKAFQFLEDENHLPNLKSGDSTSVSPHWNHWAAGSTLRHVCGFPRFWLDHRTAQLQRRWVRQRSALHLGVLWCSHERFEKLQSWKYTASGLIYFDFQKFQE